VICCTRSAGTYSFGLTATSNNELAIFAGAFNAVDIYNATSNTWATTTLSVARNYLAATSVDGIFLFAGGKNSSGTP
jgi:hypothetical protein